MRKLFLLLLALPFFSHAQTKALVGGTLIDGYGGKPLQNSVIIIEGERIKAIGTVGNIEIPKNTEVISTEGMSVMPGLWDMHVHLYINGHSNYTHWDKKYLKSAKDIIMPASAHQLLMGGVTSARDLGGPLEASLSVRDRINKGELPGPTMYMSQSAATGESGSELYQTHRSRRHDYGRGDGCGRRSTQE
jgi:imidazolonepropionase-like amidohydrolase